MDSWVGLVAGSRQVLRHYKSHLWLWQVEEEYEDHWQVKSLMDSLGRLQICQNFDIVMNNIYCSPLWGASSSQGYPHTPGWREAL